MEHRIVYADNAATTAVHPSVREAMLPYFGTEFGNPSSLHQIGRRAAAVVGEARAKIASLLGCAADEIYFTASGTESDNWAIKSIARGLAKKGKHIITSKFEHHAVLHTLRALTKEGFEVTYLMPDNEGIISPDSVEAAIRPDTILVTVMYANNEIGTIQPIAEIAKVAHAHGVLCFTDAVQAVGHLPIDLSTLGVDMLSFSGHKIHAPKGIGALYVKKGTPLFPFVDGGGQEKNKRGGTENVAYIVGLAAALELAVKRLPESDRITAMRDRLIDGILQIPRARLNGSRTARLPGTVNFSFPCIEGESLLFLLDAAGICASTGSACSSKSLEPSHVLLSIGLPIEEAHGSLRLSIGHDTTDADIAYILEKLPPIVARLRAMSPLWNE